MRLEAEVLIAADGEFTNLRLEHMCEAEGLKVTTVTSFPEIFELCKNRDFDVFVIDQDFLTRADRNWEIKAYYHGIFNIAYTLILSRHENGSDAFEALSRGASHYLPASTRTKEIVELISRYAEHKLRQKIRAREPLFMRGKKPAEGKETDQVN